MLSLSTTSVKVEVIRTSSNNLRPAPPPPTSVHSVPSHPFNTKSSVLYINRPIAGDTIASLSATVILGNNTPCVVESTCKIADPVLGSELPTLREPLIAVLSVAKYKFAMLPSGSSRALRVVDIGPSPASCK